ncbi:MAG: L-tyrosine/L-tryptophan isonitrile synthase family protein [Gemmataceae bacterium]|nr:L-tyrosine/L-tryptophan isonitrile synthase family protein [Gemmataceae bacterium]
MLRERWVRPAPPAADYRVPSSEVDRVTRAVLDVMLTRPFRTGKLPPKDEDAYLLGRVRHWVRRGRPVRVTLGHAPLKNLNAAAQSRADWAEFFALSHLCSWHNKVCAVYPPGLRIKILFDDATLRRSNGAERGHMDSYISSLAQLVKALGYEAFLSALGRMSSFAWLYHLGVYPLARLRVWLWERKPANRAAIERMTTFARRNLVLPPGLSEDERERRCREASHRFRVCWEALQLGMLLTGVRFIGRSLIAMYLDGTQHHVRLWGALHLTTLGKGVITQPWQGTGALCDNGHGQLVPFVLTAGRRERTASREVTGLDLLRLEGFDRILVCREKDAFAEEVGDGFD